MTDRSDDTAAAFDPTNRLVTAAEAAQILGVQRSRIDALYRDGHIRRIRCRGRVFAVRREIEDYKRVRDSKIRHGTLHQRLWPPTKSEQRAIVETLLLAGVITKGDIVQARRERLVQALKRAAKAADD